MKIFAWSPIRELMKNSGADMVAKDAVDELISFLEKKAKKITNLALEFSRHAQRKKLTEADMQMAFQPNEINGPDLFCRFSFFFLL